ncbi:MAG: hypothetical protein WD995_12880 [Gemmatimonadota bacterium]
MRVRLAAHEAFRPEAARVARALARYDVAVDIVGPDVDAELALRPVQGPQRPSDTPWCAVLALPEPRDALVTLEGRSATLDEVPEDGTVGLSGRLRREMLAVHRPDLRVMQVENGTAVPQLLKRGRIDGWIASVREIRAAGLTDSTGEVFEPTSWATRAGSGALVLDCARTPDDVRARLTGLDAPAARASLDAELAVLEALDADQDAPVGVLARPHGELLRVRALVPAAEGRRLVRAEISGSLSAPAEAGRRTADLLLERGAAELLGSRNAR